MPKSSASPAEYDGVMRPSEALWFCEREVLKPTAPASIASAATRPMRAISSCSGLLGMIDAALPHREHPQRRVRHLSRDVDRVRCGVQRVQVLREGLPLPAEALFEHGRGDVLDAFHEGDRPRLLITAHRREPDAAIAHDDGGHAMRRRRLEDRVPEGLAVVVAVNVDPSGRHQQPVGIQLAPPRSHVAADGDDAPVVHGNVRRLRRGSGAVDDRSCANHQVVHQVPLLHAGASRHAPTRR